MTYDGKWQITAERMHALKETYNYMYALDEMCTLKNQKVIKDMLDETNECKLCKNCKHCMWTPGHAVDTNDAKCMKTKRKAIDLVNGLPDRFRIDRCETERESGECGKDGQYWEAI
jgi:hypothetical protein